MNKYTSDAGHFDGRVDALKRFMWHRPMQHDRGFTRSHWMPPLGDYWLSIAPAAARATANKMKMQNVLTLCTHFTQKINCSYNSNILGPRNNKLVLAVLLMGFTSVNPIFDLAKCI